MRPPFARRAGASLVLWPGRRRAARSRVVGLGMLGLAALGLTGCSLLGPAPAPVPTATVTVTATPQPVATPVTAARLPAQCTEIADAATLAKTFGQTPLNDPAVIPPAQAGVVSPKRAAPGASPAEVVASGTYLRCLWRYLSADTTGLKVEIGNVLAADATAYLGTLPATGYSCGDALGGFRCAKLGTVGSPPVETGETRYFRDGVFITVSQSNFPTNGFLAAIVRQLWG